LENGGDWLRPNANLFILSPRSFGHWPAVKSMGGIFHFACGKVQGKTG